jgi:FkbM family methyltransferase
MLQIANIKPGEIETVIDCGANVGFFSLMINGIYPSASVYAIEPVPLTLKTLKKNVGTVPQIICSQDAISDKKGIAHMSFDANESVISQLSSEGSIKVNKITLDQYCVNNSIKAIDILKIDTETFEAHVLRGSSGILSKTKYLFIELTIRDNNNYTISYLMSLLYSKLYNFQLIAYRNYSNRSEGHVEIMDCLLFNQNLIGQKYN